mmetsp:Transcript_13886/g.24340  ORF Transcript_13886/g.24340 Transcript_13886/m.24340 type:complete len:133 (+) Transcript_13886:113-511(+)
MAFVGEYLTYLWSRKLPAYDVADLKAWNEFVDGAEKDRQRDRILGWRDRVANDDYAVNSEESEYYRRSAVFAWRIKDPTGKHKARSHQYLYNLEVHGHNVPSRRDKVELAAAQVAVNEKAAVGQLGPLSPLE